MDMDIAVLQEMLGPYCSATATSATTVPIATTTTSPALIRAAGLWTAAWCTSWIPGRWAGLATPEVERSAVCDLLLLMVKMVLFKFDDLSYNRWWLQETVTVPYIFHLYTLESLDLRTYSFLHPAWAAGFARQLCPLTALRLSLSQLLIKVIYTNRTQFFSDAVVIDQGGWFYLCRLVFNSFQWQNAFTEKVFGNCWPIVIHYYNVISSLLHIITLAIITHYYTFYYYIVKTSLLHILHW